MNICSTYVAAILGIFPPVIFLDFIERERHSCGNKFSRSIYHMTLDSACYMMFQTNLLPVVRSYAKSH